MSENVKRVEWFADNISQCEHYMQDQFGNVWVEIKDGATHMVATSEIQKLIEKSKDVFELTIKTIPHSDKDCLVTFNQIAKVQSKQNNVSGCYCTEIKIGEKFSEQCVGEIKCVNVIN